MSEPAAKSRHIGEPRTAIDLDDFERRLREQPVGTEPSNDPLAELARLVGGESDPFKAVFAKAPAGGHLRPVDPVAQDPHAPAYDPNFDAHFDRIAQAAVYRDPYPAAQTHDAPVYQDQAAYQDQGGYYAQDPQAQHAQDHQGFRHDEDPYRQAYDAGGYAQPEAYAAHDGQHYQQAGHYHHADGYADQADPNAPWLDPVMMAPPPQDLSNESRPRSRRAMFLMSAALVVVAGGIGGTLMFRSHAISSGEMPTIMALDGPVKVQPVQTASDAPKLSVSILEKGSSNIADSKVVDSEEQALDLNQAARTARAGAPETGSRVSDGSPVTLAPPPPAANNSIFAEPKRVKSVVVRPDGTIVANAPAAPAPAPRPDGLTSLVASTAGTGATETPRSTPAKAPMRVASAASQGLVDAGAILQVAPPPQNIPPSPPAAPVRRQVANVAPPAAPAPAPASAARGGGFAVQLAATTSGDEARDAASRLGRKFASELGSYKPGVRMYEVGSKSIYRVRVTGLSSEEANSLCARLKASGGACFVARN